MNNILKGPLVKFEYRNENSGEYEIQNIIVTEANSNSIKGIVELERDGRMTIQEFNRDRIGRLMVFTFNPVALGKKKKARFEFTKPIERIKSISGEGKEKKDSNTFPPLEVSFEYPDDMGIYTKRTVNVFRMGPKQIRGYEFVFVQGEKKDLPVQIYRRDKIKNFELVSY